MATIRLNEKTLAALPAPTDAPQAYWWDTELRGLGVVVGRTGQKTLVVRGRVGGKLIKRTIGIAGRPRDEDGHAWTVQLARVEARKVLGTMAGGTTPVTARASTGPTLREGVALHAANMRKRQKSERSIKVLEDETDRHLSTWLDRPIVEMRGADLAAIHDDLSERVGKYVANRVVAHVSAVWNSLDVRHELPGRNPARAVELNGYTPKRERIEDTMPLADWYATVKGLSPVRRDLRLFALLTAMRDEAASKVRWEHVDWKRSALIVPKPKGGESKAFELPLPASMVTMLRARQRENRDLFGPLGGDQGWAFPTVTRDGKRVIPVAETKETRMGDDGKRVQILPGMHCSRRTYLSVAAEAGVSELDRSTLANHSFGRQSVNQTYIRQAFDHLAECQATIERALWAKLKPKAKRAGKVA